MTRIRRWLPSPGLSAALLVAWLLLARSIGPGQVLLGLAFAVVVPRMVGKLRFTGSRASKPRLVARFVGTVCADVLRSNVEVAWSVVRWRWRWRRPTPGFVVIPLDLRDPLGLAMLAVVTTVVPGTVWSELALDRSAMLLHVWNVPDEQAFVARFKARYEQPLRGIFE